ncbi:hypothetical protein ACFL3V_06280 [Nanoarchaeota archaeon]
MKKLILLTTIILTLLLAGCAPMVTVKDINEDNQKFLGKKVRVSGKAMVPLDVGPASGFSLNDDSSSIMISSDDLPKANEDVIVEGLVVKGMFTGTFIYATNIIKISQE